MRVFVCVDRYILNAQCVLCVQTKNKLVRPTVLLDIDLNFYCAILSEIC